MFALYHRWPLFAAMLLFTSVAAADDCCGDVCCGHRGRPKTLFTWAGQRPTYVSPNDPEEPLVTDRPDFTEASSTVGLGRVQLEAGYTYEYDEEGTDVVKTNVFGEPLFRIGMFAEWFELRIAFFYLEEETLTGGVRSRREGGDDLYLGAKLALTEQWCLLPEMAIIPQMLVPSGADAFSADQVLPGVNWIYSWDISDNISTAGSSQINRTIDDVGEYYMEFAQSWTVGVALTDALGIYTEWFALFPTGANAPGVGAQHFFNGGFTYLVNNNLQLDIRAGTALNHRRAAPDYFLGSGFSVRY